MFLFYDVRMPSDPLKPKRRVPQQERGERRVAELLDAAAAVIAERGYEAATMTEIAERAGSSIGAMYQYFPNKEAVVRALRGQYGNEMEQRWRPLIAEAGKGSFRELADGIIDMMTDYVKERPAYLPLLDAPVRYKRDLQARRRLREHFAAAYREKRPELTEEAAYRVANVTAEIVKGLVPLYAEAKGEEREALTREFKLALASYLKARLRG